MLDIFISGKTTFKLALNTIIDFWAFLELVWLEKTSQETNLWDCIDCLRLKSDIVLLDSGSKKQCSKCNKINNHFMVSCPFRKHNSVKSSQNYPTCDIFLIGSYNKS